MARQPVTAEEAIKGLPGLPWPQSDFTAKTPFGDFTAEVTKDGVMWKWIGLQDQPALEFVDTENAAICPESLDFALWELSAAYDEFTSQILEISMQLHDTYL